MVLKVLTEWNVSFLKITLHAGTDGNTKEIWKTDIIDTNEVQCGTIL